MRSHRGPMACGSSSCIYRYRHSDIIDLFRNQTNMKLCSVPCEVKLKDATKGSSGVHQTPPILKVATSHYFKYLKSSDITG